MTTSAGFWGSPLKTARAGAGGVPLRVAMVPYRAVVTIAGSGWVVAAPTGAARGRIAGKVRRDASGEVGGVVVRVGVRAKGQ